MAQQDIKVDYDKEEDIISIARAGQKIKFSFDIELPEGDIIIDYGFDGFIVGLELFNASKYLPILKEIGPEKDIRASLNVQYGVNWAQIAYSVYAPNQKPIVNYINAPYNKKMILSH